MPGPTHRAAPWHQYTDDILEVVTPRVKCAIFDEPGRRPRSPHGAKPLGWRLSYHGAMRSTVKAFPVEPRRPTRHSCSPARGTGPAPRQRSSGGGLVLLLLVLLLFTVFTVPWAWSVAAEEPGPAEATTETDTEITQGESPHAGEGLRVLFFGSSYTYYNDLPGTLRRLAAAHQPTVGILDGMVAHPGYSLDLHWRDEQAGNNIGSQPWDVVVLQEQSQAPLGKKQRMLDHARLLAEKIRGVGARPMLFMTWAPLRRPAMIDPLAKAYEEVGRAIDAPVAPVGRAWQRALEERPDLRLHSPDGSHPGPLGTYLAACVFFGTLTGEDPRRLSDLELEAPPETLSFLREIAWQTLQGSGSTLSNDG